MFTTTTVLTLSIAKAFGVYMIAAGISGLTMKDRWQRLITELRDSAALSYITGVFVFAIGCTIVMIHNLWLDPLSIIVTLIGWGALVEGLLFIAIPRWFLGISVSLVKPATFPTFAAIAILAGLALTFAGFVGAAAL